ncbi:coenzyme F420-0:L-glutamate ligase [Candidatus Hecatella orcuttiae]|jgi:coenzyme F420-0:L-glutamate ligase|uniref:coenzyme F420-0:L-glutamate ligase n=1 Tax=Candidatus Hecatella orcuttiae TaxID=1935119 RepID=UPI0028682747|nr:coenzyme F420-0:L-glutamate ligase [Candidatus Hecatella orcuttiae]
MQLFSVKTPLIRPKDNLVDILLRSVKKQGLKLQEGDILAISSKVLSYAEGRVIRIDEKPASKAARKLAEKYSLEPGFVELVMGEAEEVYGGVYRALLTLKDSLLLPNAGIDHKNAPRGHVVLLPSNPQRAAERIRGELFLRTGKKVGVLIVDSHTLPLRLGITGIALGVAGFNAVEDCRGKLDLYGKPLLITRTAVADSLASAANLLMGETGERTPAVIIRGAPVTLREKANVRETHISPKECLYFKSFKLKQYYKKRSRRKG